MASFALWQGRGEEAVLARLREASHLAPECETALAFPNGWRLFAQASATRFYPAGAQLWTDGAGACVIHGLIWRLEGRRPTLLDAAAVAGLLARPGDRLPDEVAGEYAVARLHPSGQLDAFSDPDGVHQLFHRDGAVAGRARLLAALAEDETPEPASALWLAAIGYRVGNATGWRGVRQLGPGERLSVSPAGTTRAVAAPDPRAARGFDEALFEEGRAQAAAAIRLAAGEGPLDLPVTGGKDSRAVLALALDAGLADRLTLFTRGYAGHPDVAVAERIAAALGLPHRREPPLGSDEPADLEPEAFVDRLAAHVWQTDGGMGGWDHLVAPAFGTATLVTGHMGEVLKPYAKVSPADPADPVAIVRGQAPFDPLGLLRPGARAALIAELADGMTGDRAAGAEADELGDLFYRRHRLPNWLGGIRAVRSHERQPVMPLGVPALRRLAHRMSPAERTAELAHWRLVSGLAPALAAIPFAHQRWRAAGAPDVPPLLAPADLPLFGSWQWSLNRVPAVRAWLTGFVARNDLPLWAGMDRAALLDRLRDRRFDYLDGIALLGLVAAAFHQAGVVRRHRIGGTEPPSLDATAPPPRLAGHVDRRVGGTVAGWAWAPDWPGAGPAVTALHGGRIVATGAAEANRPDLAAAGIGDGRYGFTLSAAWFEALGDAAGRPWLAP